MNHSTDFDAIFAIFLLLFIFSLERWKKCLGLAEKNRVGRVTLNKAFFFFGLIVRSSARTNDRIISEFHCTSLWMKYFWYCVNVPYLWFCQSFSDNFSHGSERDIDELFTRSGSRFSLRCWHWCWYWTWWWCSLNCLVNFRQILAWDIVENITVKR